MSVINTNVQSLISQNVLNQNNSALNTSLERLSTGLQINSAADNPAGEIAVQLFNQQNTGLNTAISNAGLAGNVVGTAEGGLSEVSNLLTQLQGLVGQAANSGSNSSGQVAADQLQVNSILSTINRIAQGTNFQGTQLLNGNLAYVTSGVKTSAVQNLQINSASLPDTGKALSVTVDVVAVATKASLVTTSTSVATSGLTLEITGSLGSVVIDLTAKTSGAALATQINAFTNQTGVVASAALSGTGGTAKSLTLTSQAYGSNQFVTVASKNENGLNTQYTFNNNSNKGTDASVTVNGAQAEASGLAVSYNSPGLSLSLNLAAGLNTAGDTETFGITGGGANFSIGALVNDAGKASIGISDVSTAALGNATNGYLESLNDGGVNQLSNANNLSTAQSIITSAINQVSTLRGQLGAFQDFTIGSTVNSLNVALENSSAAESAIQDTNFASETSNLTRSQILSQAASTVLAQANANPQQALTLLKSA